MSISAARAGSTSSTATLPAAPPSPALALRWSWFRPGRGKSAPPGVALPSPSPYDASNRDEGKGGNMAAERLLTEQVPVGEAIVRVLEQAGIDHVFGMPGGNTGWSIF